MDQERDLQAQQEISGIVGGAPTGGQSGTAPSEGEASSAQVKGDASTSEQQDNAASGPASPQPSELVMKEPIFIASANSEIVKNIEKFLFEPDFVFPVNISKDAYELCVIAGPMYDSLFRQYMLKQLNEEEQQRVKNIQTNQEVAQQALMLALQVEHRVQAFRFHNHRSELLREHYRSHPDELFVFSHNELKTILRLTRPEEKKKGKQVKVRNEDVWNTMDLLCMYEYLIPLSHREGIQKERIKYRLVIKAEERLKVLQQSAEQQRRVVLEKEQELNQTLQRISELNLQILQNEKPEETAAQG